ncbi:MAG: hypothetical protein JO346_04885, partial [Alphaproteobacteria bacterium]|nr:hypothetical protein [Alphaproteobacteria bacterium]
MKKLGFLPLALLIVASCASPAPAPAPVPTPAPVPPPSASFGSGHAGAAWVQLMPGGGAEARVLVAGNDCPKATIDGTAMAMTLRVGANADYNAVCTVMLPRGAKAASIGGRALPVPVAQP